MELLTGPQMKRVDERAINELGIPGILLMETAGRRVYEELASLAPLKGRGVVVACGGGNNGGDGFVTARYLNAAGARVQVLSLAGEEEYRGDAAVNLQLLKHTGASIYHILEEKDLEAVRFCIAGAWAVVDSLLGTGLTREVGGLYRRVIEEINGFSGTVVATDIPSGIHGDTGEILGVAVKAALTVTFAFPKKGLFFYPGREHSGKIKIVDILIPSFLGDREGSRLYLSTGELIRGLLPPRRGDSHKGSYGRVFVLAGSPGFSGAPYLTAMAAQRSGAGLVTLGVPLGLHPVLAGKLAEVMTIPLKETASGTLSGSALQVLRDTGDVAAFGPGLGGGKEIREVLLGLLDFHTGSLVIDADGLNALAKADSIPEVLGRAKNPPILTPHPGEMSRLTGLPVSRITGDPVGVSREYAGLWQAVVVLKGAPTVVALPDGCAFVNPTGNDGMASGGSGDVLTGLVAGLAAQGSSARDAAVAGVYIHGLAGDLAAAKMGKRGMTATDILEALPLALKDSNVT